MRIAKLAVGCFAPVFGLTVDLVWSDDTAAVLDRIKIESVIVRDGKEPDVLGRVFPICLGAAAFFALPGYPVPDLEILRPDPFDRRRRLPVTADINTCRGF